MSRNSIILIVIGLLILGCCCITLLCVTTFYVIGSLEDDTSPIAELDPTNELEPTPRPRRLPTPVVRATPLPGQDTESLLASVQVPSADPRDLTARLRPGLGEIPLVVNATPPSFAVGDTTTFWVSNIDTEENRQIKATLQHKSDHLYMWVQEGVDVSEEALEDSARRFDQEIYPTNREFFGSEWLPGVDNDPRLHVLHASDLGDTVAGYFSSADEVSRLVNPYSNEKEMFYINVDKNEPGTSFYDGTLAHEFQHMIHWYQDQNENTWLNEGASELAMQLNGIRRATDSILPDQIFAENPDLQLNTWPDREDAYPHYGNSYLFMNYFLSRFGEDATKALIADPANSIESVDEVVKRLGLAASGDELFSDWVIANWLDNPKLGDGRWGYKDYDPEAMTLAERHRRLPATGESDVHQYAADYMALSAGGDVAINFQGDTLTRLAATDAYSGEWAWWSHAVDESDTRLTLPVDLTGVDKATLRFRTWYDIEDLWDYAYVEASTDGGETWTLLETDRMTCENPQGNAFGPGYTGLSGGDQAAWVLEEVDLSPFAGQPLQLRFEYVTDSALTKAGMFIDDVEIPEIGYFNDFEQGPGDWQGEGWLLTNNVLNQHWLVQVIETKKDGSIQIHRLEVGSDGRGTLQLDDVSNKRI